jgi:hypothetical protein
MSAWVAAELRDTSLGEALREPRRLFRDPRARVLKDHARTAVAALSFDGRDLYLKHWKTHRWYRPFVWLATGTPAAQSLASAARLERAGFRVPERLGATESRALGVPRDCWLVTAAVVDAQPLGRFWREQAAGWPVRRRAALLAAVAAEFARFHAAGFYSRDANADNFLVRWSAAGRPEFHYLDLENVRFLGRVSRRRRVKNLVQLYRPVRGMIGRNDRLRWLRAYFGAHPSACRDWLAELAVVDERKEREYATRSGRRSAAAS